MQSRKYSKYILLCVFASVLIVSVANNLSRDRNLYIGLQGKSESGKELKFKVPEEIIKSKDCDAFYKFRDSKIPIPYGANIYCPWDKVASKGEFVLNGLKLEIPREYMWQERNRPNGEVKKGESIYLMIDYPSMKPASAYDGDQKNNIMVALKLAGGGGGDKTIFGKEAYFTGRQVAYLSRALGAGYYVRKLATDDKPIFISHIKSIGLDYYEVPSTGYQKDIFVKGDSIRPDEWIVCENNYNSRCETILTLRDEISLYVSYRRFPHLENQAAVHSAITKLVESFIRN